MATVVAIRNGAVGKIYLNTQEQMNIGLVLQNTESNRLENVSKSTSAAPSTCRLEGNLRLYDDDSNNHQMKRTMTNHD
jgi:hypothetical protein